MLTKARDKILNSIPRSLKIGIPAGIGLFPMFIGMQKCGFVVANKDTLVTDGNLTNIKVLLGRFGLILMTVLYIFNLKGSILLGIFTVTAISAFAGLTPWSVAGKNRFHAAFHRPNIYADGFFRYFRYDNYNLSSSFHGYIQYARNPYRRCHVVDENGSLKRAKSAFKAYAVETAVGAVMEVTTVTAYVESVTGVKAGGCTSLVAVVVSALFLLPFSFPLSWRLLLPTRLRPR